MLDLRKTCRPMLCFFMRHYL